MDHQGAEHGHFNSATVGVRPQAIAHNSALLGMLLCPQKAGRIGTMGYGRQNWKEKIAARSDLSSQLVHLTRSAGVEAEKVGPVDILIRILTEGRISGSTTASGFIVGDIPATCFQDAPVYSIAQNIYAEEQYRKVVSDAKVRYVGVGLMFDKPYVYQRGGRPVVYEDTERAKAMLPEDEWWRIVRFDLSDEGEMVDWSHEREWRVPGGFDFDLTEATVLLPSRYGYARFIEGCLACRNELDILAGIKGIVSLGSVFY